MRFLFISILILVIDQVIKNYINIKMAVNESLPVISNFLYLTYVQNKGAAFGLFWGSERFLIVVGIFVIFCIIYFYRKNKINMCMVIPLSFLLGGSLGNMADRIFRAYVIDYIDFRIWPVFNFADIMINVGVFLLVVQLIFEKEE